MSVRRPTKQDYAEEIAARGGALPRHISKCSITELAELAANLKPRNQIDEIFYVPSAPEVEAPPPKTFTGPNTFPTRKPVGGTRAQIKRRKRQARKMAKARRRVEAV